MEENIKKCPFNQAECSAECELYISPDELNETVRNKLASIGIISREKGICAFKNIALCSSRYIFEHSGGYGR